MGEAPQPATLLCVPFAPRRQSSPLHTAPAHHWGGPWARGGLTAAGLLAVLAVGCEPPPTTTPADPPAQTYGASDAPSVSGPAETSDTPDGKPKVLLVGDRPHDPEGLDPEVARTETARIMAEVATARNLQVTADVKVDVMSKAAIRAFAKDSMYEDTTPQELNLMGRIEATFGKIPIGADPERIYLDLLEDGVLGLYDPKRKTLFIGDFVSMGMLSMVVGHEIAHGLQDMHFDLQTHQTPMRHRSDESTARRFLIEGGAQTAYYAWVSGEDGLDAIEDRVLESAGNQALDLAHVASPHPVLARSLQMPYTDGTATVTRLVKQKGWKAVDALYVDLPDTSEQMLHIDKLLADEQARPVKLDGAALSSTLPGLAQVWDDQVGEADLLAMVAEVETSILARRACAGWGGDHFVVFDNEKSPLDAPVVVGAIAWDSIADAEEAEKAWARYLRKALTQKSFVERKGDTFVFGLSIPKNVPSDDVRRAAWRSLTVGDAPGKKKSKGNKSKSKSAKGRSR